MYFCQMVAISSKPYLNTNDKFKNKASNILIDCCKKYLNLNIANALIMDSTIERTGKILRRHGFKKKNVHCVEREKYAHRKYSTLISGDFSATVKKARKNRQKFIA